MNPPKCMAPVVSCTMHSVVSPVDKDRGEGERTKEAREREEDREGRGLTFSISTIEQN